MSTREKITRDAITGLAAIMCWEAVGFLLSLLR